MDANNKINSEKKRKATADLYLQGVNDGYRFFFEGISVESIQLKGNNNEDEQAYLLGVLEGFEDAKEDLEDGIVDEFGDELEIEDD